LSKRLRGDLPYIDSNVFLYPAIYEIETVEEAKRSRIFF